MHLHIVSLPHTQVSPEFCGCAFTSKVLKFCKMMGSHYRIFVYAPEGPAIPGAELVPVLTNRKRETTFGKDDPNRLPIWPTEQQSDDFIKHTIASMKLRLGDPKETLILLTGGWTFRQIKEAFPGYIVCEPGVGYQGICTDKCAFESRAWMHTVYAKQGINDGRWYDEVIPNYFDPEEFSHQRVKKGSYLLFLGRIIERKGPHIASEIAQRIGMPLYVAGPGGKQVGEDIVAPEVTVKNATYYGAVNIKERAALLSGAHALLVPTTYIEPFGGVAVEAMMAGVPVVSTDWGAFTETVHPYHSGFRFRTLSEGVEAVKNCERLNSPHIREYAVLNYSLAAVKPQFDRWFTRLQGLWSQGWYN